MRVLYLDDSGKPHPNHPSKHVALAGFSIAAERWHVFTRQVLGAKVRFYPGRGAPHDWELKSKDYLTRNAWKRAKSRNFCFELLAILERNECTVYAAHFSKANADQPLAEKWVVPLAFQALVSKFHRELEACGTSGVIICDWSSHALDRHVSNCVQTFTTSRNLHKIVGGVSYGSSRSLVPIQVADLIAGTFRIAEEAEDGDDRLASFLQSLRSLTTTFPGLDVGGHPACTEARLF